jgi:Tfp pilus assembly protein FimT
LEAASWTLTSSLSYARERAIMERVPVRVVFDEQEGTWRLATLEAGQFMDRRDRWARAHRLSNGLSFKTPPPFVTFYPDGTADAASVDIVSLGENICRLQVDPLLGRATAEEVANAG